MKTAIAIVGAGVVTPLGSDWRRLSRDIAAAEERTSSIAELSGPETPAERMARRLMSRSALLAHLSMKSALSDAGWVDAKDVGVFFGVGASGGDLGQIVDILTKSQRGGVLSMEAFGTAGLRVCNPLYAFQLMNNFSMCHGAILAGTRGPNDVFFSRGFGTALALAEAAAAMEEGTCRRALVGAADTAVEHVTALELEREGRVAEGFVGGEGAASLALSTEHPGIATVAAVELDTEVAGDADVVITACALPQDAEAMSSAVSAPRRIDIATAIGDSLAATPALGWAVALAEIAAGSAARAIVASVGIDGRRCAVTLEAPR